jgi:hypothetical protein
VPGKGFVPYKHDVRSHEHDLPSGLENKSVSTFYVHLLPVMKSNRKFNLFPTSGSYQYLNMSDTSDSASSHPAITNDHIKEVIRALKRNDKK